MPLQDSIYPDDMLVVGRRMPDNMYPPDIHLLHRLKPGTYSSIPVNMGYSRTERMLLAHVEKYQMDMVSVLLPESNNYPADMGSNRPLS